MMGTWFEDGWKILRGRIACLLFFERIVIEIVPYVRNLVEFDVWGKERCLGNHDEEG